MTTPGNPYDASGTPEANQQQPYPGNYGAAPNYDSMGYDSGAGYGYAAETTNYNEKNGVAPWALGFSIAAWVLSVILIGPLFAVVGLILGILAIGRARKIQGPYRRMGMAITSVVLSLILIVLAFVATLGLYIMLKDLEPKVQQCKVNSSTNQEQQTCIQDAINEYFGVTAS